MKNLVISFLLAMPLTASANFFFMVNDVQSTQCLFTEVQTKEQAIALLEKSGTMKCDGHTDEAGTIILTCKGFITHMFFFAVTEETCESLRASTMTMLKN